MCIEQARKKCRGPSVSRYRMYVKSKREWCHNWIHRNGKLVFIPWLRAVKKQNGSRSGRTGGSRDGRLVDYVNRGASTANGRLIQRRCEGSKGWREMWKGKWLLFLFFADVHVVVLVVLVNIDVSQAMERGQSKQKFYAGEKIRETLGLRGIFEI